jgi:hypothetical protein
MKYLMLITTEIIAPPTFTEDAAQLARYKGTACRLSFCR